MIVQRIKLLNWRNMERAEIMLEKRAFFFSPFSLGKSACLDVFRFLHDIVSDGGGMQSAVSIRGGLASLRGHYDPSFPNIGITVDMEDEKSHALWTYHLSVTQENRGFRRPIITREEVWKNSQPLIIRPDPSDREDNERLMQTVLEQVGMNAGFRELSVFFDSIAYLQPDPSACGFLDAVSKTAPIIRRTRLERITAVLSCIDQNAGILQFARDEAGQPLLMADNRILGRMDGVLDSPGFPEDIFRTIVILWWLLDSDSLLLLEEPETCLDAASLSRLPMLMSRLQVLRKTSRQILISTHSRDLLDAPDLRTGEIVTLHPSADGPAVSAFMGLSGMTGLPASGEGPADDSEPMFTIS